MTNFDLLSYIGEVSDQYIMDSRKKPKKKSALPKLIPTVLAAVLALALMTTGIKYLVTNHSGGYAASSNMEATMAAGSTAAGEVPEAQELPAEEAAPAEEEAASVEDSISNLGAGIETLASAVYPESIAYEDSEAASLRWKENQVTEDTSYAVNAFSYKTAAAILSGSDTSDCYSPLSLYQTLSILASGAQGETRDQLLSLLGVSDLDTLAEQSGKLYRVNYADNDVNILKIANSLWLDNSASDGSTVSYNLDWVQSAANDYYADVYAADFGTEETSEALGTWIAKNTGGMLKPALRFDSDTVMAIVNTLWYKTNWAEAFDAGDTTEDTFTTASGETVTCDFMHTTESDGQYVDGGDYIKSYLRLESGKMIIILPDEDADFESFLTEDRLWQCFENANYQPAEVHWSVPKFETNATYDLEDSLKALGVTAAFDGTQADFSPMAETEMPLYLGYIRQGSHIAINEDGIEAASYTLAGMELASAEPEESTVVEMDLSRPFLYLITAKDGSTLFIGVVRNPNS